MTYNFFADEWIGNCGACGHEVFGMTKGHYLLEYSKHTHSKDCLGGW